ncbi:hypothetical protein MYX76_16155 [Desulfobacterota bacterium AH_259_B03_O07]|nr:hypothetical protein [Desulfobacterota bacterium AH_259_B03_O07]
MYNECAYPTYLFTLVFTFITLIYFSNNIYSRDLVSIPSNEDANASLEKARAVFLNYHKDSMNLDRSMEILEKILDDNPKDVEALIFLSRIWLTYGYAKAPNREERIKAYKNGEEIAKRAVELEPKNPHAHFFYVANLASLGNTQGIIKSLFMLPRVRREIDTVLELDPDHAYGLAIQGTLFTYLPGILGGDLKLGESYLRMSVRQDPRTSSTKIYLGRNLMKQKRYDDAIEVYKEIIDEKNPKLYADWYLNRRWARYWMAKSIKGRNEQIRSNKN